MISSYVHKEFLRLYLLRFLLLPILFFIRCLDAAPCPVKTSPPLPSVGSFYPRPYFDLSAGYRTDDFKWTIALEEDGGKKIDVLSELSWKGIEILEGVAEFGTCFRDCWVLKGFVGGGVIIDGECQDSDYDESGREKEYSRSIAQVKGYVADASIGLGRVIAPSQYPEVRLIPQAGFSFHRHDFRNHRGVQMIGLILNEEEEVIGIGEGPWPFPNDGTCATYRADWYTLWGGITTRKEIGRCSWWEATFKGHIILYRGVGHWVLREDISHFHDLSIGGGVEADMRLGWTPHPWSQLFIGMRGEWWRTSNGRSDVFLDEEFLGRIRFNGSHLNSVSFYLGDRLTF